jgi:hypothetical protein
MTSWRETISEEAQNDLDSLLNAALTLAEQTLVKYGEFFPYGAGVNTDGQTALVATDPDLGDRPAPDEVLAMLYDRARAQSEEWRAMAIVATVTIPEGDAVRVELEHREGAALLVLMPFSIDPETREVTTGDLSAGAAEPRVW